MRTGLIKEGCEDRADKKGVRTGLGKRWEDGSMGESYEDRAGKGG